MEQFPLIAKKMRPGMCSCGSGNNRYALYNTKREFVMYACHACEKQRRKVIEEARRIENGEKN